MRTKIRKLIIDLFTDTQDENALAMLRNYKDFCDGSNLNETSFHLFKNFDEIWLEVDYQNLQLYSFKRLTCIDDLYPGNQNISIDLSFYEQDLEVKSINLLIDFEQNNFEFHTYDDFYREDLKELKSFEDLIPYFSEFTKYMPLSESNQHDVYDENA